MELVAPDGTKWGERIAGSRFVRVFCAGCGEPMRVPTEEVADEHRCERCLPTREGIGRGNGDDGSMTAVFTAGFRAGRHRPSARRRKRARKPS